MTTTARTANLIIETKRVQYDALIRSKFTGDTSRLAAERVNYLADIGLAIFPEALRWVSVNAYTVGTSTVPYVPDAGWTQVLAAMDKLYKTVRDTPVANVAWIQVGNISALMPMGFRGATEALPAPVNTTGPAQTPVITTGGTVGTSTPDVGAAQTGAANLDQAVQNAGTPVVPQTEGGVIVLPTPPADAGSSGGNAITAPAGTSWWATAPDTHKAGAVAAGVVGALLLFKLAK